MDKQFKDKRYSKVDNQLHLIDKKKKGILKDLYNSYEIYLTCIRSEIFNSVSKGVMSLAFMTKISGREYEKNISYLINNEIKSLINEVLPFLTIEQLSISNQFNIYNNEKTINEGKHYKIVDEKDLISSGLSKENNFENDCYYYYGNPIKDNLKSSVDLDKNDLDTNFLKVETSLININEEKKFFIASLDCSKIESNFQNDYKPFTDFNIFEEYQLSRILEWAESIDIGLTLELKKISIEVNQKIFSKISANEIIPENLVSYLFDNNFLTTNPKPYIVLFDLLSNEFIYNDDYLKSINLSKIYLFCINPTELEFNNIHLNINRNKISRLINLLKILIKKEQYWTNKKLISNYDLSMIYKN